jgi:hypothetical protein
METRLQSKKILVSNSFVLRMHNYMRAILYTSTALRRLASLCFADFLPALISPFPDFDARQFGDFYRVLTRISSPFCSFPTY